MKVNKEQVLKLIREELMLEIGKLDPIAPPDIPGYVAGLAPRAVAAEVSAGMAQNALSQVMGIASQGGDPAAALAAIAQMVQATMEQIPEEAQKAAENEAKGKK